MPSRRGAWPGEVARGSGRIGRFHPEGGGPGHGDAVTDHPSLAKADGVDGVLFEGVVVCVPEDVIAVGLNAVNEVEPGNGGRTVEIPGRANDIFPENRIESRLCM